MASRQQFLRDFRPIADSEPITVAIPNYNGKRDIADAIRSAQNSTYVPQEIIVIDDGSTDGSVTFIRESFPEVRIIELGQNSGGILNKVRNRALVEAKTRLVFLMDHDIVLHPSCLSVLVFNIQALPDAAVLTTRALFHHDPERIYVDAQGLHFLCNAVALTRDHPVSECGDTPKPSVGWGTQLIDKEKAAVLGFFDEDYVIGWGDDGEFQYKMHLVGLRCYSIPNALVYHKRDTGSDRFYSMIHNRWYLIIETYAFRTIVLLAPALLLYEIALFAFVCLKGRSKDYLLAIRNTVSNFPKILHKRARLQEQRQRSDRDLLSGGPIYIRADLVQKRYLTVGMALLNGIFEGYWRLVKRFI
jgi:GT2 family glycosyltransferase